MKRIVLYFVSFMLTFMLAGCGKEADQTEKNEVSIDIEDISQNSTEEDVTGEDDSDEISVPSKEEVLAMREIVLEGMSEEEIERLTENIKVANLQMESAYLNNNIFDKLSEKDSPYWQYFDQEGDIQLGWWYNGMICDMEVIMKAEGITEEEFYAEYDEPGIVYNRFDAENFIELLEEMQSTVHNEQLRADLQQLIDLTGLAADTHDVRYANEIYKILHDLDYFLLRYGIEDVGKYTQDVGTVSAYYGVLKVYGGMSSEEI